MSLYDTELAVVRALNSIGFDATFEHPGCVVIGPWWFGTANETWGASHEGAGGVPLLTDIPRTCTDPFRIAGAIVAALTADARQRAEYVERLHDALDRFKDAARDLNIAWDHCRPDAIDQYPDHWQSFEEEMHGIMSMLVVKP